jgi:hypothetical protein
MRDAKSGIKCKLLAAGEKLVIIRKVDAYSNTICMNFAKQINKQVCNLTTISEVLAVSIIALMIEAACTSEMSVNFYQTTQHNNPEDSHLQKMFLLETEPEKIIDIFCFEN